MAEVKKWESIPVAAMEMNLQLILTSGQAFRWVRLEQDDMWGGAIGNRLFFLRHHDNELQYQVATPTSDSAEDRQVLVDYFRLDTDISSLYRQWSTDDNFKRKASCCQGIRLLQQPALEVLLSFICSSNNQIARITQMVCRLSERYGQFLGSHGGNKFYSFPDLKSLVGVASESELREMGFGYRAKYVVGSVGEVTRRGGEEWLSLLRQQSYEQAWAQLQQLPGVGSKVADCVCLMGLGHLQAVPVDVHMWRLAQRDYGMGGALATLTPSVYRAVGEKFREVFGANAGWAQAVMFTAELISQRAGKRGQMQLKEPLMAVKSKKRKLCED